MAVDGIRPHLTPDRNLGLFMTGLTASAAGGKLALTDLEAYQMRLSNDR